MPSGTPHDSPHSGNKPNDAELMRYLTDAERAEYLTLTGQQPAPKPDPEPEPQPEVYKPAEEAEPAPGRDAGSCSTRLRSRSSSSRSGGALAPPAPSPFLLKRLPLPPGTPRGHRPGPLDPA